MPDVTLKRVGEYGFELDVTSVREVNYAEIAGAVKDGVMITPISSPGKQGFRFTFPNPSPAPTPIEPVDSDGVDAAGPGEDESVAAVVDAETGDVSEPMPAKKGRNRR